jgi:hypothetical protein
MNSLRMVAARFIFFVSVVASYTPAQQTPLPNKTFFTKESEKTLEEKELWLRR